ncbi:MAG: tRNA uridine-5-carboxymethylaminomethyl(34) synthesis GTPase MnmE [Saprospiraceae bacterium]|uniref:tRNA modification GTPase MnmE n=1 Tax=Candidatus Opimibacter skivensis TaxID=2982028 RepID=A0A9D7SRY2_9BACT|nr:tRNA uridine-5-carboxymethylaminomethyl(34) synthesis GTPase MnmE [Candidatus Opimibacter skivensis]
MKEDTIVAIATGDTVSAIGLIRLSGPKAISITNKVFKGRNLSRVESHTMHYGRIIDEDGQTLDDVIVSVYKSPKSFTTEDVIEISCHGSPYILHEINSLLIRQGARPADPGEFTMRAFLNGRMDLSQAEAVADLIESQSKASHLMAMRQMKGEVSSEIQLLREKLIDFASLIELELDFGEENVEFADREKLKNLVGEILLLTSRLKETFHLGNAIKEGIPTVIAGRPNAGKSTLLNKLLQEDRAIVSATPGTTRDTIEEVLVIDGIQFRLIDTAGIREAHDEIESMGIQRTMDKIEKASILIYVFDVTTLSPSEVAADLEAISPENAKVILAANKMDLNPYTDANEWKMKDYVVVPLSAINNMNVVYLREVIRDSIKKDIPDDIPMISSARHYHALDRAEQRLSEVFLTLGGVPNSENRILNTEYRLPNTELLAQDIRQALFHLGTITGEISSDDVLGNIFSRFCIGK